MKKRFEVSAEFAWKIAFEVDAESEFYARIQASQRTMELCRAFCPSVVKTQILACPTMDDYTVREIPLSVEERRRRERVDQLLSQCSGPVFERAGRWYKWICPEATYMCMETGQKYVIFDGGHGTEEEYESWREREIARCQDSLRQLPQKQELVRRSPKRARKGIMRANRKRG